MVFRGYILKAVEKSALKRVDWFGSSDIKPEVDAITGEDVSLQRIGSYLGKVAEAYWFLKDGGKYKQRELFGRRD